MPGSKRPGALNMQARPLDTSGYTLSLDANLSPHNSLRVTARASLLARLHDATKLPELLGHAATQHGGDVLVLGEGSNVLFTADYTGMVVLMATRGVWVEEQDNQVSMAVAAGERWDDFVRWTLTQGFSGLENLILIPGTVGAAPIQNIGAYGVEVAEFIDSVETFDTCKQAVTILDKTACAFGYRDSVFKHVPGRYIVTAVRFTLPRQQSLHLEYAGIRQELKRMGVSRPAAFHVAQAIGQLRTRKLPNPAHIANAGSFFKNPFLNAEQALALKKTHPDLPMWSQADGRYKLSAAWLVEAAGFNKGYREGDAGISRRHALVLVNHGKASGAAIWALGQRVMEEVYKTFGIHLSTEPQVIGNRGVS